MTILQILNQLESTSSLNEKKDILRQHLDNELLKKVFQATMDARISYYIKKIPAYSRDILQEPVSLNTVLDNLGIFSQRIKTGHDAARFLQECLESLSTEDATVLERIIKRDLRCGVKQGIINDVFGEDFLYSHPVLLASKYEEKNVARLFKKGRVIVQLKNDGLRCTIEVHPTEVIVKTRAGQVLDLRGHFDSLIGSSFDGFVLDGELMVGKCDRKTGNGILYKAQHGTISDEEIAQVFLASWDRIPLHNFLNKTKTAGDYEDRLRLLQEGIDSDPRVTGLLTMIPSEVVTDLESARQIAENYISQGLEGAIFKSPDLAWEDKRSKDIIKFKAERTADMVVVGWEYGAKGRQFEKALGGLVVETRDGKVRVTVGSGFSHDQRFGFLDFWNENLTYVQEHGFDNKRSKFWIPVSEEFYNTEFKELIYDICSDDCKVPVYAWFDYYAFNAGLKEPNEQEINKVNGLIVEVLYNELIQAKGSLTKSMFLPRLVKIRHDKTQANSFEELE